MKTFILLLLFPLLCMNLANIHETYVSVTEIQLKNNRDLEISIELTAHDFEYAYNKEYNTTISTRIYPENQKEYYNEKILFRYLKEHFIINAQTDTVSLKIIGHEINLEGTLSIYIEGSFKNTTRDFNIYNDMLVRQLPNQQNIVNLKSDKNLSFTFNKNIKSHEFK